MAEADFGGSVYNDVLWLLADVKLAALGARLKDDFAVAAVNAGEALASKFAHFVFFDCCFYFVVWLCC